MSSRKKVDQLAALALALGALVVGLRAAAVERLQALGEATLGWSDNLQSSPDDPPPGVPEKKAGALLILSPGVALIESRPGSEQRLGYTMSTTLLFDRSSANTSTHRLDYLGAFDLSPRAALLLGATATQSRPYAAPLVVPSTASELAASAPGRTAFLTVVGHEDLSIDLAPRWRGTQGLRLGVGLPLASGASRTFDVEASAGPERIFREDALGAEGRGAYTVIENAVRPDGERVGTQRQVVAAGVGIWRRDWGRDFTSRVEAGAMRLERLESGKGFWHPTGMASLAYVVEAGTAELGYSHRVGTNLVLGQSMLIDEVRVGAGLPLVRGGVLLLGASCGYQWQKIIGDDATRLARVNVLLGDIALGYRPSAGVLVGLRYQHVEQDSDARRPPLPLSFARNSVLASVGLSFPPDREMPRPYRPARRVDRSDEIRGSSRRSEQRIQQ